MDQPGRHKAELLTVVLLVHHRLAGVDIDNWTAWLHAAGASTTVRHVDAGTDSAVTDSTTPDSSMPDVIVATEGVSETTLRELAMQSPDRPLTLRLPADRSPPWRLLEAQGASASSFPHMTLLAAGLELVSR